MTVYAGIDEAGYGPTLGPYVVGVSAFNLPGAFEVGTAGTLDLFGTLSQAIAATTIKGTERVLVADSKKLFTPGSGVRRLEEAVLAFYLCARPLQQLPIPLRQITSDLVTLVDDAWENYPWYAFAKLPINHPTVPIAADVEKLKRLALLLTTSFTETQVYPVSFGVSVVPVAAFNRSLKQSGNKSTTSFQPIGVTLASLWKEHGEKGVIARIDKQGGRARYEASIRRYITDAEISVLTEEAAESRYVVVDGRRKMLVCFAQRSDARHFPVCLASIIAKYFREVLMDLQNRWFCDRERSLRPTAGYPGDAPRWLEDSAGLRESQKIDDQILVRNL